MPQWAADGLRVSIARLRDVAAALSRWVEIEITIAPTKAPTVRIKTREVER